MKKYYIVDESILPDVIDKVIESRSLIESGTVKNVSDAVKATGISRGTYYKYKDYVFTPEYLRQEQKAVISFMLHHVQGGLSQVLKIMSKENANIISINQNLPIHDWASVVISFDIFPMACSLDKLIEILGKCNGVQRLRLISVE